MLDELFSDVRILHEKLDRPNDYIITIGETGIKYVDQDTQVSSAISLLPAFQRDGAIYAGLRDHDGLLTFISPVYAFRIGDYVFYARLSPTAHGPEMRLLKMMDGQPASVADNHAVINLAPSDLCPLDSIKTGNDIMNPAKVLAPEFPLDAHPLNIIYRNDDGLVIKEYRFRNGKLNFRERDARSYIANLDDLMEQYGAFLLQRKTKSLMPVEDARPRAPAIAHQRLPTAKEIKAHLDQHVIGQEDAKITVSAAAVAYLHDMRYTVALVGSTGVGKTELAMAVADYLGCGYKTVDLQSCTKAGYIGGDVYAPIQELANEQDTDTPRGVIIMDEIDKTAVDHQDFVGGEGVQSALLPVFDGKPIRPDTYAEIKAASPADMGRIHHVINTSGLLCITAGAFARTQGRPSIDEIVSDRLRRGEGRSEARIGFGATIGADVATGFIPQDLIEYGLKPELVARIKSVARLSDLTIPEKRAILESKVLPEYLLLFERLGRTLTIDDDAKDIIVAAAHKELGGRGVREACERVLRYAVYDPDAFATGGTVRITGAAAQGILDRSIGKRSATERF